MTKDKLDSQQVPQHIAIIMDGNRRWAKKNNLDSIQGHQRGSKVLESIVEAAADMGVKVLTAYTLSTENIKERPKNEILALFKLIRTGFRNDLKRLIQNGVKLQILGEESGLPGSIKKILRGLEKTSVDNKRIQLNIALNYGGRRELVQAVKKIVEEKLDPSKINEQAITEHLYTDGQVDPQLVIRTGGSIRLSNFLLWQTAYSELYFTEKLWPDFGPNDLRKAILWYQNQKRNFGR